MSSWFLALFMYEYAEAYQNTPQTTRKHWKKQWKSRNAFTHVNFSSWPLLPLQILPLYESMTDFDWLWMKRFLHGENNRSSDMVMQKRIQKKWLYIFQSWEGGSFLIKVVIMITVIFFTSESRPLRSLWKYITHKWVNKWMSNLMTEKIA